MISIIVPVYEVERWLPACLDSILAQTYRDFELILIDNGSPDQCGVICDLYAEQDSRVKVIHQENHGLSAARNTGTAIARGDYITYIDSDDAVQANYLEVLLRLIDSCGADVAVLPFEYFAANMPKQKKKQNESVTLSGREACKRLINQHERYMITAWGKLYKSSLKELLKYPEGRIHEDEFVTYKVLYKAGKVVVGSEPLYGYRQREGSILSTYTEKRLDKLDALSEAIEWFENKGDKEMATNAQKRYLLCIEIAWYNVHKEMKNRKDLEMKLQLIHRNCFKEHRKEILYSSTAIEKAAIRIFNLSPQCYSIAADLIPKKITMGKQG